MCSVIGLTLTLGTCVVASYGICVTEENKCEALHSH